MKFFYILLILTITISSSRAGVIRDFFGSLLGIKTNTEQPTSEIQPSPRGEMNRFQPERDPFGINSRTQGEPQRGISPFQPERDFFGINSRTQEEPQRGIIPFQPVGDNSRVNSGVRELGNGVNRLQEPDNVNTESKPVSKKDCIMNRDLNVLQCDGVNCIHEKDVRGSQQWKCGSDTCVSRETPEKGFGYECSDKRALIDAPDRDCPDGQLRDRSGRCRDAI